MGLVDLDSLVSFTHPYWRFHAYLPDATEALADVSHFKGADGYGVERLFRWLLIQFMEDLSDRELARYLEENLAAKWLCGFTLSDPTPDHSLFTHVRTRIGPMRLSQLFATMREQLKVAGLMSEVFTFVDASHLIAKATRRYGCPRIYVRLRSEGWRVNQRRWNGSIIVTKVCRYGGANGKCERRRAGGDILRSLLPISV